MTNIGFRATPEDERIIKAAMEEGERTSDVIRRALRLLEREIWLKRGMPTPGARRRKTCRTRSPRSSGYLGL